MKLTLVDILIICAYLASTIVIGLVMKKRAQKDKTAYMLGGNKLPWYMLGLSNASGMFDISGTMWLVTLAFVYGLKSIWIPWLWPVFNQIFLMVFLSIWLRRSNATTGAEWIRTRFGSGRSGVQSHWIVVAFALISCLGFLTYGFIGLGKFVEIFIPWEVISPFVPFEVAPQYVAHVYGIVFTLFAMFYAILGGMSSIVWADVIQYTIMTISAIVIGVIAMNALTDHPLLVPEGWMNPFFGARLEMDWSKIIGEVNEKIISDGYSLLSTKSPKDAAKMSGFVSVILMPTRYFMIAGFAVLGLLFYDQLDLVVGNKIDFEQILPSAISQFVPVGFMGLLLAGLLAAFMSTFAGTLNAAQAYIVNDIYLKYMKPDASQKQVSRTNYLTGIVVVAISVLFGFFAQDVNSVLQWIVSALWGAYVISNMLKWYWWRFNGSGFFWGMFVGIISALICSRIFDFLDLYYFPIILVASTIAAIVGTFLKPPTDEETLKSFYKNVKPWGFWKPIHEKVVAEDPSFEGNKNLGRDIFNVVLGTIAQTALVIFPIYIVLKKVVPMGIALAIITVCFIIMKKTWWDTLPNEKAEPK